MSPDYVLSAARAAGAAETFARIAIATSVATWDFWLDAIERALAPAIGGGRRQ